MGHVLSCGLDLISSGVGTHVDHALKQRMEILESLANKSNISYREKLHAKAVKQWAEGYESKSTVCHVTQLKCIIPFFFSENSIDFKSAQLFEGMCCVVDK